MGVAAAAAAPAVAVAAPAVVLVAGSSQVEGEAPSEQTRDQSSLPCPETMVNARGTHSKKQNKHT